jgi:hypothetical protein
VAKDKEHVEYDPDFNPEFDFQLGYIIVDARWLKWNDIQIFWRLNNRIPFAFGHLDYDHLVEELFRPAVRNFDKVQSPTWGKSPIRK